MARLAALEETKHVDHDDRDKVEEVDRAHSKNSAYLHKVSVPGINNIAWVENGVLHIGDIKLGKTDRMAVPIVRIDYMYLNRKLAGKYILHIYVGSRHIELKSATAETLMGEILANMRDTG